MPSCALMYFRTAAGSSLVDGVAYSAIGMLPSVVSTSASTARSSGMPATAKPVAIGGCACTTAWTSGRCRYTSRCISISDEGSRSPCSLRPSRSVMHIMSGVMKPLQTLFGVMSRRSDPSLTLMFPSLDAVYPRAYMRRPTSTMSARSEDSLVMRYGTGTHPGTRRSRRTRGCGRRRASPPGRGSETCRRRGRAPSALRDPAPGPSAVCPTRPPGWRRTPARTRGPRRWRAGRTVAGASSRTRLARAGWRAGRVRRLHAVKRTFGGLSLGSVGRERDDLPPRLGGAVEVLLAECLHDADVQQRLGVLRIDLEGTLELLERLVGLVRIVVADPEVGAHVDVVRRQPQRVAVPLGIEVEVAELRARRGVGRLTLGDRLERVHLRVVEHRGARGGRSAARRRARRRLDRCR